MKPLHFLTACAAALALSPARAADEMSATELAAAESYLRRQLEISPI